MQNKRGATRLGFTLIVKFSQLAGRFPAGAHEIPAEVVQFVALQVGVDPSAWEEYPWQGRSVEYHRASICAYLGFREATVADAEALEIWLVRRFSIMNTGWIGFVRPSYLVSKDLRQEIHEGLNVVESWNSTNGFIFYGKNAELASNKRENQALGLLCLHLLQASFVYVNTLMIHQVLGDSEWSERMTNQDLAALSPLMTPHINPYGCFELDRKPESQ